MNIDMNKDMNKDMNIDMNIDMNKDMNIDMKIDMNRFEYRYEYRYLGTVRRAGASSQITIPFPSVSLLAPFTCSISFSSLPVSTLLLLF